MRGPGHPVCWLLLFLHCFCHTLLLYAGLPRFPPLLVCETPEGRSVHLLAQCHVPQVQPCTWWPADAQQLALNKCVADSGFIGGWMRSNPVGHLSSGLGVGELWDLSLLFQEERERRNWGVR